MNDYGFHVKGMFQNLDPGCCVHSIFSSASDGYLADIGCIDNGVDSHLVISCLLEWDMGMAGSMLQFHVNVLIAGVG